MRAGRAFATITSVVLTGAILAWPDNAVPVAYRFIAPLFAEPAAQTSPLPDEEQQLPDYVPGSHTLSFSNGAVPAASAFEPDATGAPAAAVAATLAPTSAMPDAAPAVSGAGSGNLGSSLTASPVAALVDPASPSPTDQPAVVGEPPSPSYVPAKALFGAAKSAAPLAARAIGTYARGCLAGGMALPVDGPAWQAMRLSRNRNWGHPNLVKLVQRLAVDAQKNDNWPGLLVGDISQPRGGPMLTGHASHQVGLDADVWLTPMPSTRLSPKQREDLAATSMLDSTDIAVDPKIFTADHVKLIKRAASYAEVERVLVHPAIKKALCQAAGPDRKWLGKVRPIGGHYYHFHIRMACPPGSGLCQPQKLPTGEDGCGKEVDEWLARLAPSKTPAPPLPPGYKPRPPKPPISMAQMPQECRVVLESGPDGIVVPPDPKPVSKLAGKVLTSPHAALRPHLKKLRSAAK